MPYYKEISINTLKGKYNLLIISRLYKGKFPFDQTTLLKKNHEILL